MASNHFMTEIWKEKLLENYKEEVVRFYKIKKWMNKVLKTQFKLYKLVPKKLKIWE